MSRNPPSGRKGTQTRREAVRERRRKRQRQQRLYIVFGVIVAAVIIVGLLIIPDLLPAGDIISITPNPRPMAQGRAAGDPNAPVTIEVYEDFQCPACKNFSEQISPLVKETYVSTGQVYYVFRHYPFLDDNAPRNESDQAANASMCAADENRFWDYHDMLFANWNGENRGSFNDRRLLAFAEALDLNMPAFNECFDNNFHKDEIDVDFEMGRQLGVTGTPSVLVNGTIVSPGFVPSFAQISEAVERELANSGG